jgi:MFS family permease
VSWSGSRNDRSGGRRKRGRRRPRWVTDRAQEIANSAPERGPRSPDGPPHAGHWYGAPQGGGPSHEDQPRYDEDHRWEPPPPTHRWRPLPDTDRYRDDRDGRRYHPWDHGPDDVPRSGSRDYQSDHLDDHPGDGGHPDRPTRAHEPADTGVRTGGHGGPRKLTVTRVAAWRSRQLTRRGIAAFRRAATADGADRSGLTALTFPVMASFAADAAVAVALANTLFFSAATAESKTKVALYLLITVAPFALLAPVIGPLLDRLQRGRRVALAVSFVGRALLAIVMAQHFNDWLLYPAALGFMVLTRSFGVLKAAVTPRVLSPEMTLTKTNSRLAVFGLAAGGVTGAVAAAFAFAFGSAGALVFTAAVCLVGAWLCLRIPAWVEVTEGEVPASLRDHSDGHGVPTRVDRRREPLGRHVVVALWGNGTIRILTGFLTLFVAFVVKAQTEHSPWQQIVLLGMVGAAAGAGNVAGNALGARQHFGKPDQVILTCVIIVLGSAVLAALVTGIGTAVLVGLVGSTCSSLAKVCQDAVIQQDMPEESRASAFGRTETILQLAWTFGGALGVLLPPTFWIGFTVISALLVLGTLQTVMAHRGSSLIPRLGGVQPARPGRGRFRRPSRPSPRPAQQQEYP